MPVESFIFGTDDIPDYETLKRRRELAKALAAQQSKHAHPLVQGFSDLGHGIGGLLGEMRLSAAEKKFAAREAATDIPRGGVRAPAPVAPPAAAPAQAPVRPAPMITTPPPPAPPAAAPVGRPNPVQHNQSTLPPDPNVDVVAETDFNRLDAAAGPPPAETALSWATEQPGFPQQRFNAAFDPTNAPVEPVASVRGDRLPVGADPSMQVAARFPNEVPPAQEQQNAFAPPTATEPTAAAAPARSPAPLADLSKVDPRLAAAIQEHGGQYKDYLTQMAIKEANGRLDVVSKTGAAGPLQFTKGAAKDFGLSNRFDPVESVKAGVRYTDHSANQLAEKGLPVTYSNLAVLHQQGHTGGANLLTGRGVPARNLAVNNVDPRSAPEAAAARIKAYYGFDDNAEPAAAAAAPSPYQNANVRPDTGRADLAQTIALNPQIVAEQEPPPGGQPIQTAEGPDSEQGTREMLAAALAGQQRPQGVQLASSDPARMGGITMPRAEPMGRLPLMQSQQNPQPPQPPPGQPEIPPDPLSSGASFLPGAGGMDIPGMGAAVPEVTPDMLDPFAIPFNGAPATPAAGAPADAGIQANAPTSPPIPAPGPVASDLGAGAQPAVPVAPDVPAEPAPSVPVQMAQALTPGAASDAGPMMIGGAANVPPVIAPQQPPPLAAQAPVSPIATAPVPAYVDEAVPEVRPMPRRPEPIPPSPTERELIRLATSPILSPYKKAQAAAELQLEQGRRDLDQKQQDADYVRELTGHEEEKKNRREWLEAKTTRDLTNMKSAAEIAMKQAEIRREPLTVQKLQNEILDLDATIRKKGAETRETEGKIEQQIAEKRKKTADATQAEIAAVDAQVEQERKADLVKRWGNLPPEAIMKQVEASQKVASGAAKGLEGSLVLRNAIADGMITGFAANARIDYNRAKALLGDQFAGRQVTNNEVYQAMIQPIVASIIASTVGGSQVSNVDLAFANNAAGADPSLQASTLRKLIEIRDEKYRQDVAVHKSKMDVAFGNEPNVRNNWEAIMGANLPKIDIPQHDINALKANPTPYARDRFNLRYGVSEKDPASRILQPLTPGGR